MRVSGFRRDRPVLVVCPGGADGRGGIGRHVRYVTQAWQRTAPGTPLVVLDSYGGRLPMPLAFSLCALRLAARAATGRAGLVHLHMAADGSVLRKLLLARLAALFRLPVIVHVHGSRFEAFVRALRPVLRAALGRALARADRVIALGPSGRAILTHELSLDPSRIVVMPNAIPLGPEPDGNNPGQSGEECRIAFLGRVGARKGMPELLAALAALDRPGLAWHATIAGDGEVAAFRARAASLELDRRVTFTGWLEQDAAAALLARSDLLVLPSRHEGQPIAILEAMAAGLPVIASAVGAIPDLIRDGVNGLLVAPGEANGLARTLERLVADPSLRRRLGRAARATVVAGHDIDAACRSLQSLYAALIRRGRALDPALAVAVAR